VAVVRPLVALEIEIGVSAHVRVSKGIGIGLAPPMPKRANESEEEDDPVEEVEDQPPGATRNAGEVGDEISLAVILG